MTSLEAADTAFEFIACWGNIRAEDAEALRAFWRSEGALRDGVRLDERLPQVVMYARSSAGDIVGACTAERLVAPRLGQPVYYWRTFTASTWRAKLPVKALLLRSCALLEIHARAHGFPAIGVLLELENAIFKGKARNAVWRNPRFVYIGRSARGLEVRVYYFRGAKLKHAGPTNAPVTASAVADANQATVDQQRFDIIDCWPAISEADASAVQAFWSSEQAMDDGTDAQARVQQVVAFARD
ncbi:MAG: hypothetical protein L0H70_09705, partial [Xanthomonadales bacterium]|nr:hypothetical protein [Xanthomonadales bacterium]